MTGPVAIIGMSGRFPGADDIDRYWANLVAGVESIEDLTPEQLQAAGVPADLAAEPDYVPRRALVPGHDRFDAAFFGYSPREAELMDPQQRLFLQHAYDALTHAGHAPGPAPRVGVYAASTGSTHPAFREPGGDPRVLFGNEGDHLAARVAYKLDLRGPSLSVHTACSSSLVAVHLAVRALQNGDCDLALAGGVSVDAVQERGYRYQEGGILSPDGRCRAFDAAAAGSVSGGGVGVVVLRRLADAGQDTVHAVVLGTAVNNDGADRVGYPAPGVAGQSEVVALALAAAGTGPETVGFVEAHGTATAVGDPIEVLALHRVYRPRPPGAAPCALGSVKTNIGHLDAASGIAGLVKAALAVRTGIIPPTLHYTRPNPMIDFADGPFHVNTEAEKWPDAGLPRRAGVSSFGIGGTNAHVVLEEPPPTPRTADVAGRVLVVSARTEQAADRALAALREHLAATPDLALADVAGTLALGRTAFRHRRAVIRIPGQPDDTVPGPAGDAGPPADGATERDRLRALATAWVAGAEVDWASLLGPFRRVPLPGYPFEPTAFPLTTTATPRPAPVRADPADWFWRVVWRETAPLPFASVTDPGVLVLFGEPDAPLASAARAAGHRVVTAVPGDAFSAVGEDAYRLRPDSPADHAALLAAAGHPGTVVHTWTTGAAPGSDTGLRLGAHSLLCLARALADGPGTPVRVLVVTTGTADVGAGDPRPGNATVLGPARVMPQELPHVRCRVVDVTPGEPHLSAHLLAELADGTATGADVALRGDRRWVSEVVRLPSAGAAPVPALREHGVYLITGGLGRIGLHLAEHLVDRARARVVLLGRSADHPSPAVAERLRALAARGGEVFTAAAGADDEEAVRAALAAARARFGPVDGVFHAAGVTEGPSTGFFQHLDPEVCGPQFAAKVTGTVVVDRACAEDEPDFVVLMSSISVLLGGLRLGAYAAANAFLDGYAAARNRVSTTRYLSIAWDPWLIGEAIADRGVGSGWGAMSMSAAEGLAALDRLLPGSGCVVVSPVDLRPRLEQWVRGFGAPAQTPRRAREGSVADRVAALWRELLGIGEVGHDESFFAVGGDSLLALQLAHLVRDEFGVVLPAGTLFAAPTVRELAAVLGTRIAGAGQEEAADRVAGMTDDEVEELLTMLTADTATTRGAAFLFPGFGAQRRGMGAALHRTEPEYRTWVEHCLSCLPGELADRLAPVLTEETAAAPDPLTALRGGQGDLADTELAQVALFVTEYALARLLAERDVAPVAVIGHSLGEYTAACVAGMVDVPDAVRLVAERARLVAAQPSGAMLAVPLPETELRPYLGPGVDLAAVNGRSACTVSGTGAAITAVAATLAADRVATRRLDARHPFHSTVLAQAGPPLTAAAARLTWHRPEVPCVATATGTWFAPDRPPDPAYWAAHLTGTVRFHDGLAAVLADPDVVLVEVGHGSTLSAFARQHTDLPRRRFDDVVPLLPVDQSPAAEPDLLAAALTTLAGRGVPVGRTATPPRKG